MSEQISPQNIDDTELSTEELEGVDGGTGDTNNGCTVNNCTIVTTPVVDNGGNN